MTNDTDPTKNSEKTGGDHAADLLGVASLIAPLVGALGALALTGTIGRIQRDHPVYTAIAIGVVVAGSAIWSISSAETEHFKPPGWLRYIAIGVVAVGTVGAVLVSVWTADQEARPRIIASLSKDSSAVSATVEASNIKTKGRLAILINPVRNEPSGTSRGPSMYEAYIGPDTDGNVKQSISVPVPTGQFAAISIRAFTNRESKNCDDLSLSSAQRKEKLGSGTGCVVLSLDKGT